MTDNTTRVIKLANGESIVCTCIPTRTDEASDKLHVIQPLKMELKNKITKKGVVEALPKINDTPEEEDEFENSEEVREMFKEYVTALSGDNKEREMIEEEISEEELDSIPCSTTKH